ncbi:hypothetical protein RJP21_15345 [Paenibacillus sp. VCA1]|uniref:hypothetical protein n=1 Tax=Paenibacillus sp. VCA1 TaxID=3039148 RepID=UPI0028710419|nr:hypothetical protein [Paenibacillus sp. VCA1]MDR9854989.1 hypothetical protein [Paenibacillus sp. VCA1]
MKRKVIFMLLAMSAVIVVSGCGNSQKITVQTPAGQHEQQPPGGQPAETKEDALDQFKLLTAQAKDAAEVIRFLDEKLPGATPKQADQLILELEHFYDRYLPSLNDNFDTMLAKPETAQKMNEIGYPMDVNNIKGDDTLKQWLMDQMAGGLALGNTEGMFFWKVDYKALQKYNRYVSTDIRSYLALKALDAEKNYIEDGALAVSREELGDRMMKAEYYMIEHPEGLRFKEVLQAYKAYLDTYLTDYRYDAIDDRTGKLLPDVKKSYRTFVGEHPESKTAIIVKKYLEAIERNKDVIYEKGSGGMQGPLKKDIQSFWDSIDLKVNSLFVPES